MKKIILFVDRKSGPGGRLFLQRVQQRLAGTRIQVCQSVDACVTVIGRIRPCMETPIVVLWVDSRQSLDDLYRNKHLFENRKIVMVLPEEKTDEFTAVVHRFFPRYVAFMDDRYDDLCEVLNKMMIQ
jgi:hypothetical protein